MQHVRYNPDPLSQKNYYWFCTIHMDDPWWLRGGPDPWTPRPAKPLGLSSEVQGHEHLKQVLNGSWGKISQELINDSIDHWSKRLCCWSFIRKVDTLNIVSVNSVICAC